MLHHQASHTATQLQSCRNNLSYTGDSVSLSLSLSPSRTWPLRSSFSSFKLSVLSLCLLLATTFVFFFFLFLSFQISVLCFLSICLKVKVLSLCSKVKFLQQCSVLCVQFRQERVTQFCLFVIVIVSDSLPWAPQFVKLPQLCNVQCSIYALKTN